MIKKYSEKFEKTVNFHITNSGFNLMKLKNEFKALFEILMAETLKTSFN